MMTPETEEQVAEAIRDAKGPMAIQGGGTRGVACDGETLSIAGLKGVTLYEPGALTLVARAGTPVAEIEAVLAEQGQRLAFEPMDHRGILGSAGNPTIGGVVAANISGPRRIQVGAARDFALGVRFVDGTGAIVKNGGRVMKNVTGYDLVKLFSGSWGRLGVLTEVSLKVLPIPETSATLLIDAADATDAVGVMTQAMASAFDVSGAAYDPAAGHVALRVEGFTGSVAYRAEALRRHIKRDAVQAKDGEVIWQDIRDVAPFHNAAGDVWRVSVKPTDGPTVVTAAEADGALLDWSGGLVWVRTSEGTDLRAKLAGIEGHATLIRASADTKARLGVFQPEVAAVAALTAGVRKKFDPRGILNVGIDRLLAA